MTNGFTPPEPMPPRYHDKPSAAEMARMSEIALPEVPDTVAGYKASFVREFARQAVMAERERCAKLADDERVDSGTGDATDGAYNVACEQIAAAIRRGQK